MSDDQKKSEGSKTPGDQFTWTDGSTFGLSTFFHDMEEGEGVQQSARLPQSKGLSSLPPGILSPESDVSTPYGTSNYTYDGGSPGKVSFETMDVRQVIAGDTDDRLVRLPALDWLEFEDTGTDPDRLPRNPADQSIAELEEAWGVHRRTDGLDIDNPFEATASFRLESNNKDLDAVRQEKQSIQRFSKRDLHNVVRSAARRSAAGEDIRSIFYETAYNLGEEAYRVRNAMLTIKEEHGLAGNVFVRASMYPGCHNGDWTDHVNDNSKTARYIVADRKCSDCVFAKNGSCEMFQRQLVSEVPWEDALETYRPHFEMSGVKLASNNPKESLRTAFSKIPKRVSVSSQTTEFPVEDTGVERLEARLSKKKFADMKRELQEVRARQKKLKKRKLAAYLDKLEGAQLLSKEEVEGILRKGGELENIKSQVQALISKRSTQSRNYQGGELHHFTGNETHTPKISRLDSIYQKVAQNAGVKVREVRNLIASTRRWMNEGIAGSDLDHLIQKTFSQQLCKSASSLVSSLREKYEGLAGHLYVDAASYATPRGVQGCEEGASRHRTNAIPHVLEMSRCADCVFRNAHDECTKYGKELVKHSDFEGKELKVYKKEMIRQASMSEAERTASLFAPIENPVQEWGLGNRNLEGIDYYDSPEEKPLDVQGMNDGFDLWNK